MLRCPACLDLNYANYDDLAKHILEIEKNSNAEHIMWLNRNVSSKKLSHGELSKELEEFENIYIDYNFKNDFSRFYNGKTFVDRIIKYLPENLTYNLVHIKNMEQVCPQCYAKFALLLTKN